MNFDIIGQKAYLKYGPYQNQMGVIQGRTSRGYELLVNNQTSVDVELQDLILMDVDFGEFSNWCEQNGL